MNDSNYRRNVPILLKKMTVYRTSKVYYICSLTNYSNFLILCLAEY